MFLRSLLLFAGLYAAGISAGVFYAFSSGVVFSPAIDEMSVSLAVCEGFSGFFALLCEYAVYPLGFLLLIYISAFTKAAAPVCGFIITYRAFYAGYALTSLIRSNSGGGVYTVDAAVEVAGGLASLWLCVAAIIVSSSVCGRKLCRSDLGSGGAVTGMTLRFLTVSGIYVLLTLSRLLVRMF